MFPEGEKFEEKFMKYLVIVESPTKAKTIRRFLPSGYVVDSSMGHIRDLPASAKEIPARFKKESWANLGINVEHDFEPLYVIPGSKKKVVKQLQQELKEADELILATDEDREGEGIAWHLIEVLKPKIPVKRMVFHEITETAIRQAMEEFRSIDMNLVYAQETRRFLDRLAGYTLSPLLWKKISPGLSAGRVQSVAVRLLVERERERIRFRSGTYWDLKAKLKTNNDKLVFEAGMTHLDGKRLATGKDFDEATGKLKGNSGAIILGEDDALKLQDSLGKADWAVTDIEKKKQKRSPAPPFITSTLQQEANRKFGLSASNTMRIAQRLYENGFITYMRTDSTNLSQQAINAARTSVKSMYGDEYLFDRVRTYSSKSKGAQEAHEAIRPAGQVFKKPDETGLSDMDARLYDLIWKRTIATQMADAELEFTNATIEAETDKEKATFKASGKRILFAGYFRAYVEGSDDPEAALDDQDNPLPELHESDPLECLGTEPKSHETKPPARYTEATLVKELEKEGIGRPSTYATIISTIIDRNYAVKDSSALVPTFTAFAVTNLLEKNFPDLVDLGFTSNMEELLDEIARGRHDWKSYLNDFYTGDNGLRQKVENRESSIDPQDAKRIDLPIDGLNGYRIFVGRFGPYIQTGTNGETVSTSIPQDVTPGDLSAQKIQKLVEVSVSADEPLGKDPETGNDVYVLTGRYGPYVQLGENTEDKKKPRRVSLPKGLNVEQVDLETALKILSLPRTLGQHPESGKDVKAGIGRYGPFVVHDGTFASLKKADDVLDVTLERALELLSQARKKGKGGSNVIKELGTHPQDGKEVRVMTGRYGPYIKYGKKNISLPKSVEPDNITLEEAVELIAKK